jgi:hypothetical protein
VFALGATGNPHMHRITFVGFRHFRITLRRSFREIAAMPLAAGANT